MLELFKSVKNAILSYQIGGFSFALFTMAVIYLILTEDGKKKKLWIFILMIMFAVLYPFHLYYGMNVWGIEKYVISFLLLPVGLVICYVGARTIQTCKTKIGKGVMALSLIFVLFASLNFHVNLERFECFNTLARNLKTPDGGYEKVLTAEDLTEYLPEGLEVTKADYSDRGIMMEAKKKGISYVVISKDAEYASDMEKFGFDKIARFGNYQLYKDNGSYDQMWLVTQYGTTSNNQMSFYSLSDAQGHLILVDGGWDEDAAQVRDVIAQNGGHVDAWIITHQHTDHCNALSNILESGDVPDIDVIYTPDVDYDKYKKEAQEWDVFSDYERFLKATADENVKYLYTGDELDICGLKLKVFHDYTAKVGGDALNDGNLIFRFEGELDSILFCGDCGVSQSDVILDKYRDELGSTMLQLAHHGNGGLNEEFYRAVKPSVAFFDAPDWLMHPKETDWYTTTTNINLMKGLGAKIRSFETAPNREILR